MDCESSLLRMQMINAAPQPHNELCGRRMSEGPDMVFSNLLVLDALLASYNRATRSEPLQTLKLYCRAGVVLT
eukprot:3159573-Amphidinium_carterae.1